MSNRPAAFIKSAPRWLIIFLWLIFLFLLFLSFRKNNESFSTQTFEENKATDHISDFGQLIVNSSKHTEWTYISDQVWLLPSLVVEWKIVMSDLVKQLNNSNASLDEVASYDMNESDRFIFEQLWLEKILKKKEWKIDDLTYTWYKISEQSDSVYYHVYFSTNTFTDSQDIYGLELVLVHHEESNQRKLIKIGMMTSSQRKKM